MLSSTAQIMLKKVFKSNWKKWNITFRILPVVALAITLKVLAYHYDWELIELNALFTSMVGGTIFLISFLVKGVLTDYKESEKIPSEMAATLKTLFDDASTVYGTKKLDAALEFQEYQRELLVMIHDWFYRKERTAAVLQKISGMNAYFIAFDLGGVTPNYIIKMKAEQSALRKMIMRIDTIRDTGFIGSAYAIVEAMGASIAFGLVIIKLEPLYAAIFFILLVTFLITYMLQLIKDLDNPFDYSETAVDRGTEVPLKPLDDLRIELGC